MDQVFSSFSDFMFKLLTVIADHRATDFYPLVARIWDAIFDAMAADYTVASTHVLLPHRVVVLRAIVDMYAPSHPDIAVVEELISATKGGAFCLQNLRESMATLRDKQLQLVSVVQQQQIERFNNLLRNTANQDEIAQLFGDGEVSWTEVDSTIQAINQLCSRSRQQDALFVPLMRSSAGPLSRMLTVGSLTKSLMSALCQTLVALVKCDSECAHEVAVRYIESLRSLRPALKESAVAYVLDFLAIADASQRQEILQVLFDDSSDIARSKLGAYLKSSAFRSGALALAP